MPLPEEWYSRGHPPPNRSGQRTPVPRGNLGTYNQRAKLDITPTQGFNAGIRVGYGHDPRYRFNLGFKERGLDQA